jgi:site-specific DNA-cytosine methylase
MSSGHFRGLGSPILQCMWDFVNYAAKVKPVVAVFESVQLAYSQGRILMQQLRAHLEEQTGLRYDLVHVLHNALSVGGPSMRKRYFWVVSQVPFGIERPVITELPVLNHVIGDLAPLPLGWERQHNFNPVVGPQAKRMWRESTDGHAIQDNPNTRRLGRLLGEVEWKPGWSIQGILREYHRVNQRLPADWEIHAEKMLRTDFFSGFTSPVRWKGDEWARVITGAGLQNTVHPFLPRTLTHREVARIMGFNDAWKIAPLKNVSGLAMTWGKGITVDCGRWIGEWIGAALRGTPGSVLGETIGDRERLINVTNDWQSVLGTVVKYGKPLKEKKKVTEVIEGTEAVANPERTRAGRPRSSDTLARDEQVLTVVSGEYPVTRGEATAILNAALNEKFEEASAAFMANPVEGAEAPVKPEDYTESIVYLSLWRLRRDGKVGRRRVEGAPNAEGVPAKTDHRWHASFAGDPVTEDSAEAATDGELVAA